MNSKQWYASGIGLYLLGILFVKISLQWKAYGGCMASEVNMPNIYSCIRGETFALFPYIFFGLGALCFILPLLESKK